MEAHSKGFFGGLALTFALVPAAFAQSDSPAYLDNLKTSGTQIRAGFIPRKTDLVFGEPLQAIFTVQNLGPTNFAFEFGGDYRGTGRHDHFTITAKNSAGAALPDPIAHPWNMGGILDQVNLKPGEMFTNVIDLTQFRVVGKPGDYAFNCSFGLGDYDWVHSRPTGPIVRSVFVLKILERTPDRVANVINELLAKAQNAHGPKLNEALNAIANFGQASATPCLAQLSKTNSMELRTAALAALSLIPTDDSIDVVLTAFKDPDPAIRAAAAASLGAMQKPRAVDALLARLPHEESPVSETIIRALGTSKSERAFATLTNTLDSGEIALQRAAIDGLVNYGGSNAVDVLRQHINTNYLPLRHDIVGALAEKLHEPMQPEWLVPVLMKREQDSDWHDSLTWLRTYAGSNTIPILLSALDFDVPWSGRNWWILNAAQYCPGALQLDYYYDNNSDGSPAQLANNRRTLETLKPLAGPIPEYPDPPPARPVEYLKTDPPIDFVPVFREVRGRGIEIKSGFLVLTLWRGAADEPYAASGLYRSNYAAAARFRALANASAETTARLKITPEQMTRLNSLLRQFAVKLCGSQVSAQRIGNFCNSLISQPRYCPDDPEWWDFFWAYLEAPPSLKDQTKTDLIDSVVALSENYHEGTMEFAKAAGSVFTPAQIEEILR